jgi:hypothetical protein
MLELTDAEIEAKNEPFEETLDFLESIEAVCIKNIDTLSSIGGNLLIAFPGVGAWTLVTKGKRAGLYGEATDDDVDFAMCCEEWVLHELLDPDCEIDADKLEDYTECGVFRAEGDFQVFQRFLRLAQGGGGNAVNIRTGR